MPTYFHATTQEAWQRIQHRGLDPAYAQGKDPAVWLHTAGFTTWAVAHTIDRHHVPVEAVVILQVRIPRPWLVRFRRGMWKCRRLIGPQALTVIGTGPDFY
jgi:hypothetical protein